jgi:hypothetical protein
MDDEGCDSPPRKESLEVAKAVAEAAACMLGGMLLRGLFAGKKVATAAEKGGNIIKRVTRTADTVKGGLRNKGV